MKSLFIGLAILLGNFVNCQTKDQVDQRLVENHGDEVYSILEYRKDYYNFLQWELDFAYQIIDESEVSDVTLIPISTVVDKFGISFNVSFLENPSTFNFMKYNFEREKEQDVYYDLGDGRVLKFKALKVMWQEFNATGLNTKN